MSQIFTVLSHSRNVILNKGIHWPLGSIEQCCFKKEGKAVCVVGKLL